MHYVVTDIETGLVLYSGDSESDATLALDRGTVFGTGQTEQDARQLAYDRSLRAARIPGGYKLCEATREEVDAKPRTGRHGS